MKHVQIVAFCDGDIHEGEGEPMVPATMERTVSIDGSKPALLDLCDACDSIIAAAEALMKRGAQIDLPAKKAGKQKQEKSEGTTSTPEPSTLSTVCPEPGCGLVSASRTALGQHTRSQHGKGLKAYKEAEPTAVPQSA